jgi:hypothetical protein
MADWKQITARIRRARTSKDPAGQLSALYEKTHDAMVAFELAKYFETSANNAEAANGTARQRSADAPTGKKSGKPQCVWRRAWGDTGSAKAVALVCQLSPEPGVLVQGAAAFEAIVSTLFPNCRTGASFEFFPCKVH